MSFGFVIIRHVNSKITDYYWKECYRCIRKFYDNPIIIIDDSSNKEFLNENIFLQNCTVIYDKEHKGAAELLPYYYFLKLKPFETAVIIHDSVFIQSRINFELDNDENIRFIWSFNHCFNHGEIFEVVHRLAQNILQGDELMSMYHQPHLWSGSSGVMSVIRWSFLEKLDEKHQIFLRLLPQIKTREHRQGLERLLGLIAYFNNKNIKPAFFGEFHNFFNRYDISFIDYITQDFSSYPIMKTLTGR